MTTPEWWDFQPVDLFCREQAEQPAASDAPRNFHLLVRGGAALPPGECELRVCADDHYQLWLDGQYMGQGPVPAYPGRERYDTYPLEGDRTVTIALHLYYQGLVNRVWNSGDGRFGVWVSICQKGQEIAACGEDWLCRRVDAYSGAVVGYDTQFLENFDSRRWPEGWEQPEYQPESWERLIPAAGFECPPAPRPVRPLWEGEIPPVDTRPVPGGVLFDFGAELAGNLALAAQGQSGGVVTLRFGEELDEAGRVRFDLRCGCRYEERWTLAPGISILHQYDYKAFRYAEVLSPRDVQILRCMAHVRHYPVDDGLCALQCDADQLGDIFRICKNAVRVCTQDSHLDCATREKGQYLGDAVVAARSQVWLTGSTEMLRKCVRDFIASGKVSPALMAVAPGALMQEIADYSLLFPLLPLTDYEFTGEKGFLAECYPAVQAMTEYFTRWQRADGLLEQISELWNMVDWPEGARDGYDFPLTRPVVRPGCHNAVNALWYGANRMEEKMARLLGLPAKNRSTRIGAAFRKAFYRPEQRLFADSDESAHCSLHANLYAAYFGLLPPEGEDSFEALLFTPGRYCGVMPMYFALRALGRMEKHDALYKLLTRQDEHGWRNMLREGATACFEAWGKDQKWNTSLCHPWASGAISILIEDLAGLRPDPEVDAGYRFQPRLPERAASFALTVPFRGWQYRITKEPGEPPRLERMSAYAVPENE